MRRLRLPTLAALLAFALVALPPGAADVEAQVAPGTIEGQLAAELAEWADIVERMLLMLRLAPPLRARHGD